MTSKEGNDDNSQEPEYSSHAHQLKGRQPTEEQIGALQAELLEAYKGVLEYREVPFIRFGDMNASELAEAFKKHPSIIKPTLCCVNVAQRAIKRDLGVDINTYGSQISDHHATLLAAYIKPMLPELMAVPALMELDRYFWTDKEMRAQKGNWEKIVTRSISTAAAVEFKKRRFTYEGESFELDAAYPATGESIDIGVDVKRIESPRDIHKRTDEIINKSIKFKGAFPDGRFYAVVYFPFPAQHLNLSSRLQSQSIDGVYFAGETESSVTNATGIMVGAMGLLKK
jgi:hypothetical protein